MKEFDTVELVTLSLSERYYDGTESVKRPPRVGDEGAIVHIYLGEAEETIYIVENVDKEGNTIWLADFTAEELKLIREC